MDEGFFAAAGGLPDMDPVGGFIAGTAMTRRLDEGFEQDGPKAVAVVPVVGQAAGDEGEDFGCQTLRLDPRQHEEAGVVDDERQIALALRLGPADEALARRKFPRTGAEADESHALGACEDLITHLAAGQRRVAQIVITGDVLVPQPRCCGRHDRLHGERRQLVHGAAQRRLCICDGGNLISPSACMRSSATRQVMSLRAPFGRTQPNIVQIWRDSGVRLSVGRCSIKVLIWCNSSALKRRPQYTLTKYPRIAGKGWVHSRTACLATVPDVPCPWSTAGSYSDRPARDYR